MTLEKPYVVPSDDTPVVVGKVYHVFNDGKVSWSRHSLEKIVERIPFDKFKEHEMYSAWEQDVSTCYWLFSPNTDYILVSQVLDADGQPNRYYTRTRDGGWFGFGSFLCDGRLDYTRELWKEYMGYLNNGDLECSDDIIAKIREADKY